MTLVDIGERIWSKLVAVAKHYNDRPVAFFLSLLIFPLYLFLITSGFKWDVFYALQRMLFRVNPHFPEDIFIGWALTIVHVAALYLLAKKLNK